MTSFPKLRYPIATKGLNNEERMVLLAYDMIYRLKPFITGPESEVLIHDSNANLANLGHYIENNLCGGDMALRFEGYDNSPIVTDPIFDQPTEANKQEWMAITENELNK